VTPNEATLIAWDLSVKAHLDLLDCERGFVTDNFIASVRADQRLQILDPRMATPLWVSYGGPR
jgi:hypothetical protein